MSQIEYIQTGLLTHWVDMGRRNIQRLGYSQSGPVDWISHKLANAVVGNDLNQAALEVHSGNFTCKIDFDCVIAITGSDITVKVNSESVGLNVPLRINAGDVVSLTPEASTRTNYMAISAVPELSTFAGSVCTVQRELSNNALSLISAGSKTSFTASKPLNDMLEDRSNLNIAKVLSPAVQNVLVKMHKQNKKVGVLPCYQASDFVASEYAKFFNSSYQVSAQYNRMGVRLEGQLIKVKQAQLTSQPIANGSIQITLQGMPIILRHDRQTMGGYPIIGALDNISLAMLGQVAQGDRILFSKQDHNTARLETLLLEKQLVQLSTLQENRLFSGQSSNN